MFKHYVTSLNTVQRQLTYLINNDFMDRQDNRSRQFKHIEKDPDEGSRENDQYSNNISRQAIHNRALDCCEFAWYALSRADNVRLTTRC